MNIELFLTGAIEGFIFLGIISIPILFLMLVLGLAKYDMFWTIVPEGRAKAVIINGEFKKFVMAFHGKKFIGKEDEANWVDQWDVIDIKKGESTKNLPLVGGLRWVGIWPFAKVYKYRFNWTSLEQQSGKKEDKSEETRLVANTTDEPEMDYILLQKDMYAILVTDVETSEMLPLTALLQIPAQVVNPYKALFKVQHWLEQSENEIADKMRAFMGGQPFANLIQRSKPTGEGTEKFKDISNDELDDVLNSINEAYGIEIPYIGIRKIDPATDEGLEFKKAAGAVFVADQIAKADKREGEGKRDRVLEYYTAVSNIEGGRDMFGFEAIRDSKIRVISGNGVMPTVLTEDVSEGEKK